MSSLLINRISEFTYIQSIAASGSQITYKPGDAISAQTTALNGQVPANYVLENSSICSTPTVNSFTGTSASVTCTATGTVAWNWGFIAVGSVGERDRGQRSRHGAEHHQWHDGRCRGRDSHDIQRIVVAHERRQHPFHGERVSQAIGLSATNTGRRKHTMVAGG